MYPDGTCSGLLHDCSVQWLGKGQHKGCSSAPFSRPVPVAGLRRWSCVSRLSCGTEAHQKGALQWLRLMSVSPGCKMQLAISCLTGWFRLLGYEAERAVRPPLPLPSLRFPTGEVTSSGGKRKKRGGKENIGRKMVKCNFRFSLHKSGENPLDLTWKVY